MNMMRHILSTLMVLICLSMVLSLSICPGAYADNCTTPARPAPWDHIVSVACGDNFTIGLRSDGRVAYAGDNLSPEIQKIAEWEHIERIEVQNGCYAVGYKEDGGVRLVSINGLWETGAGEDSDVEDWNSVRQIYVLPFCWVGLQKDGGFLCTDWSLLEFQWGRDESWDGIEDIQWGVIPDTTSEPYGIRKDGTLAGFWTEYKKPYPEDCFYEPEEPGWHDIINIYGTEDGTYALRRDGRICCYSSLNMINNDFERSGYSPVLDISTWTDVAEFHCDLYVNSPVALRRDGTVVTLKANSIAEEISGWSDIKMIAGFGDRALLGLRKDGTVLSAGTDEETAREIASWTDVKTIMAIDECFLALRNDGTVLATSTSEYPGEDEISIVRDIRSWTDVEEIAAVDTYYCLNKYAVGLCSDGTVLGAGNNSAGQLDFDITNHTDLKEQDLAEAQDGYMTSDSQNAETDKDLPLPTEGTCGENLRWKLDESGCLTVSGTGEMDDYGYVENKCSWDPVREKIKKVSIEGAETIGSFAFSACINLEEIVFSDGLKSIGDYAFSECGSLKDLHFPDSVRSIGYSAFSKCVNLVHVELPKDLLEVSAYMFYGCKNLTEINIPENTVLESGAFKGCTGLKKINMPEHVSEEERSDLTELFSGCSSLEEITLPEGIRAVPLFAFRDCTNLQTVTLPESLEYIDAAAFMDCPNLQRVYYHGDGDWKMTQAFPVLKNTFPERCGYFDAAEKLPVKG